MNPRRESCAVARTAKVIGCLAGACVGSAVGQTVSFSWRFADETGAMIADAHVGSAGYLVLDMEISPLAGVLAVSDPEHVFAAMSAVTGSVMTGGLRFVPVAPGGQVATLNSGAGFGDSLTGFYSLGGTIGADGTSTTSFGVVGPPASAAWDASAAYSVTLGAFAVEYAQTGRISVGLVGREVDGVIVDEPYVDFGMFAGRRFGTRVVIDENRVDPFSSLDLDVVMHDASILVHSSPTPATVALAGCGALFAGRRRRVVRC